jgi:hypothetical protein
VRNLIQQLRLVIRIASAGFLCLSLLFWITVALYCIRGFISSGMSGVTAWLQHIAAQPSSVSGVPEVPDWNVIGLRFAVVAAITLALWLVNRRLVARFVHELRQYTRSLRARKVPERPNVTTLGRSIPGETGSYEYDHDRRLTGDNNTNFPTDG